MNAAVIADLDAIATQKMTPWLFRFWQSLAIARAYASVLEHEAMSKDQVHCWISANFPAICESTLNEVGHWNTRNITPAQLTQSFWDKPSSGLLSGENIFRRGQSIKRIIQNNILPEYKK